MSDEWTPAPARAIKVGDQTRIDNAHGGWNWHTITAVGTENDNIVIHLSDRQIVYPADAQVMVRTAEDREAVCRRHNERMEALFASSQPWYLKLINRFAS